MSNFDPNSKNKAPSTPGAPPGESATQWYMHVASETYGPYAMAQLREFARDGRLTVETLVWTDGADAWRAAGEQASLRALFAAAPPPRLATPAPPAPPATAARQGTALSAATLDGGARASGGATARGMSFGQAVHICFREKYATFQGRARRAEYWWFALFMILVFGVVGGAAGAAIGMTTTDGSLSGVGIAAIGVVGLLWLAFIVPSIAVAVRRLHDLGWSGWWFLAQLIPFVGGFIGLAMIIGFMMRGNDGPNKYGPDPLAGG